MYLVIVGAGQIGSPFIELATDDGHEVVVIERDEDRAQDVADRYDCLVINADATVRSTFDDANAERADALISTANKDATNVMVCLLAKQIGIPTIVSVVHDPDHMSLFEEIGVSTMENPQRLIAEHLYRSVVRPSIIDYMRIGDEAEVFEITIDEDAPIAGKTLREAAEEDLLGEDLLIVALERSGDEGPVTPKGSTKLHPGDLATVYSGIGAVPDITDIFGHYEDHD